MKDQCKTCKIKPSTRLSLWNGHRLFTVYAVSGLPYASPFTAMVGGYQKPKLYRLLYFPSERNHRKFLTTTWKWVMVTFPLFF